jgi:hypothetical protein
MSTLEGVRDDDHASAHEGGQSVGAAAARGVVQGALLTRRLRAIPNGGPQ